MFDGHFSWNRSDESEGGAMAGEAASFTEVVDSRAGSIRARGRLTVQGADLLSGAVDALHRGGHRRVLVDLGGLQGADDAGLVMLEQLRTTVAAEGRILVLLHPPARSGCSTIRRRVTVAALDAPPGGAPRPAERCRREEQDGTDDEQQNTPSTTAPTTTSATQRTSISAMDPNTTASLLP